MRRSSEVVGAQPDAHLEHLLSVPLRLTQEFVEQ